MLETAEMSRLTVAAPVGKLEEVIRACSNLECIHIEEYSRFEDGIGVGASIKSENAEIVSRLLTKTRSLQSEVNAHSKLSEKISRQKINSSLEEFEVKVDQALEYIDLIRDSESEIGTLNEQLKALM